MWGLTRYLHRKLIDAKQVEWYVYVNLELVLKARIGKKKQGKWVKGYWKSTKKYKVCWIDAYSIQSRVTFYPKFQYGVCKLVFDVLIYG